MNDIPSPDPQSTHRHRTEPTDDDYSQGALVGVVVLLVAAWFGVPVLAAWFLALGVTIAVAVARAER